MTSRGCIKELARGVISIGCLVPMLVAEAAEQPQSRQDGNVPPVRYQALDDSIHHVRIDGSSNVTKWHVVGQKISGGIDIPGAWERKEGKLRHEPRFTADEGGHRIRAWIPVLAIEGDKEGLSKKMYKQMKAYKHRYVTFALKKLESVSSLSDSEGVRWDVQGALTISGVTRNVDLSLDIKPLGNARLQVELQKGLKMSDFKIEPPTALGGFVRAYDKVDVKIGWVLERQSPQPTIASSDVATSTREAVSDFLRGYSRVYQAVRDLDGDEVDPAVEEALEQLDALKGLDVEGLEDRLTRLNEVLVRLQGNRKPKAMRSGLAQLSQATRQLLEQLKYGGDQSVVAYRYSDEEGVAAKTWLQVYTPEAKVSTPYSDTAPPGVADVVAIYPAQSAWAE